VRRSRGQEYPLTKREREQKEKGTICKQPAHLAVPRLPHHPLVHSRVIFIRPILSFYPLRKALGNGQPASPTWDWLTTPGHPPGFSLPGFSPCHHQFLVRAVDQNMRSGHSDRVSAEPAAVICPFADHLEVGSRALMSSPNLLAMAFLALSKQDFLGGGGGISIVPWCKGPWCYFSLLSRNRSEILSLR